MVPTLTDLSHEADTKQLGSFGKFPRIDVGNPLCCMSEHRSQFREVPQGFGPIHYFHYFLARIFNCSTRPANYVRDLCPSTLGSLEGKKAGSILTDKSILQLHSQAELGWFTQAVPRSKPGKGQGWKWMDMAWSWISQIGASWKWKYATLNGLSTSHDQNRDVDLENLPALWFQIELTNKQWMGYTGNEDFSGQTHSFQGYPDSSEMCREFII